MQSNARVGRDSGWVFVMYLSRYQCLFDNAMVRDIWTCDGRQILGHSFLGRLRPPCDDCVLLELVSDIADFRRGMFSALVPFARCISWEQTDHNLKEAN